MMEGDTYGIEAWGSYAVADWWQLKAGFNIQHEDLRFKPGSSGLGGTAAAGDDPHHQADLQSSLFLAPTVNWTADIRWIGKLPNPVIPACVELNTSVAWDVTDKVELSLSGFNLLHAYHLEYEEAGATVGDEVDRRVFVETKLRF
jgi:iron complex outermembrane receptor protein